MMERGRARRWLLRRAGRIRSLPTSVFGHDFPNPVGLAAGMDKRADALLAWQELGFGWMEYGGITGEPQSGNPRPRMFRAGGQRALVNRMGFNNPGCDAAAESLAMRRSRGAWPAVPVAANLGRSKAVSNENADSDYSRSLSALWPHADLFVINVSSPNTPELRELQSTGSLSHLLTSVLTTGRRLATDAGTEVKPLLIKIAPDLPDDSIRSICDTAMRAGIAGIVATNTTTVRPRADSRSAARTFGEAGGLSGRPLQERANEVCRIIHQHTDGVLPIVGVGGIDSGEAAWQRIAAGACLLQIYTGLIFEGADLAGRIVDHLNRRLAERGMASIADAVGCETS